MCVSRQHYWRSSEVPFVELRCTFESVQSYKPHFHKELSFGAVIAGSTRASCAGREILLGEGDLVLVAPNEVHSCNPIAGQPRSYHMLYVNEAWCLENVPVVRYESLAGGCRRIHNARLFAGYLEFIAALPSLRAAQAAQELQRLLMLATETQSAPASRLQHEPLAEQIKQALLDSLSTPVTLAELAERFRCRKETLIRVFSRAFYTTPHSFLNSARIEQAKRQLKQGETIAAVAADLGFSDQAQLHRAFVNYTASTPGQYRRALRTGQ